MQRFDFEFTEEERIAYLKGEKDAGSLGNFYEVLLVSGSQDQPAEFVCEAIGKIVDQFDIDFPNAWHFNFQRVRTLLEGTQEQVAGLLITIHIRDKLCGGFAVHFSEPEWRMRGMSTLSIDQIENYKPADKLH